MKKRKNTPNLRVIEGGDPFWGMFTPEEQAKLRKEFDREKDACEDLDPTRPASKPYVYDPEFPF